MSAARTAAQLEKERLERQRRVGRAIKAARKDHTQAELGEMLAAIVGEPVPQTTISRWEQGSVSTDLETLRAIELALKLPEGTLFASTGYVPVSIHPREMEHMLQVDPNLDDTVRSNAIDMYRNLVEVSAAVKESRRKRSSR